MNDAQVRENVLDEAKKCVLHDRNSTYGKPEDNFRRIAELWTAYDEIRKPGPETPTDVAIKMTLMKIARLAHNPKHKDSWIDGIGYLACGAGIEIAEDLISRQSMLDSMPTKKIDHEDFTKLAEAITQDRARRSMAQQAIYTPEAQAAVEQYERACQTPSTSSGSQS